MYRFEDYLSYGPDDWHWHWPDQFNIADACITQHAIKGSRDKIAIRVEDHRQGCRQVSYGQLEAFTQKVASNLQAIGIQKGDRVLIRLSNSVEYPVIFFGCLRYGAIPVPTSTLLSANEVAYLIKDSGTQTLVTTKTMYQDLQPMLSEDNLLKIIFLAGPEAMPESSDLHPAQLLDFDALLADAPPIKTCCSSPRDPAYLVYTSGTSGYPKGVLHGHQSLIGRLPASRYWFDFQPNERILHSGKLNWTYVLGSALMDPLFHGHTVVIYEGPNNPLVWPDLIRKHHCTTFIGVPTIYRQIIEKSDFSGKDVPSLRHCMSAGEHLSEPILNAWRERFGQDVYEAIGMSECSYYISEHKGLIVKPGAAGQPQPGHDIHLFNDKGEPVDTDEEGMIAIPENDPGLFLRYWRLPEETSKSRHDGFFYTGDYALMDKEGYIWFLGRKDDIINTFGYRVSPYEVERVMKTHPAISHCIAVGEEISNSKVLVSLCVILSSGKSASEEELLEFGRLKLAKYKAPKRVHFYDKFPRSRNGKIMRKQLLSNLKRKP